MSTECRDRSLLTIQQVSIFSFTSHANHASSECTRLTEVVPTVEGSGLRNTEFQKEGLEASKSKSHKHRDSGVGLTEPTDSQSRRLSGPAMGGGFYESRDPRMYTYGKNNNPVGTPIGADSSRKMGTQAGPTAPAISEERETMPSTLGEHQAGAGLGGSAMGMSAGKHEGLRSSGLEASSAPYETSREGMGLGHAAGKLPSEHSTTNPAMREHTNLPSTGTEQVGAIDKNTGPKYWGDMPRGTGVYNTVTGHGSQEDAGHHVASTMSPSGAGAEVAGGYSLGPGRTIGQSDYSHDYSNTGRAGLHDDDIDPLTPMPHTRDTSGAKKEALGAAAVGAGATGVAAHEMSHKDHHHGKSTSRTLGDTTRDQYGESGVPKRDQPMVEGLGYGTHGTETGGEKMREEEMEMEREDRPKERRGSRVAALFRRDHTSGGEMAQDNKLTKKETDASARKLEKENRHEAKKMEKEAERRREHEVGDIAAAEVIAATGGAQAARKSSTKSEGKERDDSHLEEEKFKEEHKEPGKLRSFFRRGSREKGEKPALRAQEGDNSVGKKQVHDRDLPAAGVAAGAAAGAGYGAAHMTKSHDAGSPKDKHVMTRDTMAGEGMLGQDVSQSRGPALDSRAAATSDEAARVLQGTDDSHGRAAAVGTGAALAGAGAAGYHAHKHHEGRDSHHGTAQTTDTLEQRSPIVTTGLDSQRVPVTSGPGTTHGDLGATTGSTMHERKSEMGGHGTRDTALAGTGLAAAGTTGYLASQKLYDPSSETSSTRAVKDFPLTTPASTDTTDTMMAGTGASHTGHQSLGQNQGMDTSMATSRSSKDPSQGGMYNVLPSGTPSGMNMDYSKPAETTSSTLPMHGASREYDNTQSAGMGAAPMGAALGTGAAAAGYGAHKHASDNMSKDTMSKDMMSKDMMSKDMSGAGESRKFDLFAKKDADPMGMDKGMDNWSSERSGLDSMPAARKMHGGKVMHKCHRCGEENDISSYFT